MMSSSLLHYISLAWPVMVDLVFNFTTGLVTRDQPETAILLTSSEQSGRYNEPGPATIIQSVITNEYNNSLQSSDQPSYYQTNHAVFLLQLSGFQSTSLSS